MIVDSSALVAIIRRESDRDRYADALQKATRATISAASYLETAIVVDRVRDPVLSGQLDELLAAADVEIAPVTPSQARLARAAYRDFGKNSGHPARLNFGDCFSYALAKDSGESLLFKGSDFAHTAIRNALQHPDE